MHAQCSVVNMYERIADVTGPWKSLNVRSRHESWKTTLTRALDSGEDIDSMIHSKRQFDLAWRNSLNVSTWRCLARRPHRHQLQLVSNLLVRSESRVISTDSANEEINAHLPSLRTWVTTRDAIQYEPVIISRILNYWVILRMTPDR